MTEQQSIIERYYNFAYFERSSDLPRSFTNIELYNIRWVHLEKLIYLNQESKK